ncbi:uncharacterized protein LOC118419555 [Branchiostoma floridae]|uniref:Uncharacterized protein LOC118419555 n=1 Tax=Branchiostoma floridae TaxID=7739 RepID=A0A9J7LHM7_BRAFL|nr:uncharacterized protein LOC118419555 [Branchiostoma floridae]
MGTREVERWHDRYDEDAVRRAEADLQRQHEDERERDRQRREHEREERDRSERHAREAREQKALEDKMTGHHLGLLSGLKTYTVGKKKNIKGLHYVNIAMFGPTGSGKSSFIQTAEQILLGKTTALVQADSKEGTTILEKYLAGSTLKFHLVDTRGFFDLDDSMHQELDNILTGKIRPSQVIVRSKEEKESLSSGQTRMREGPVPLQDKIHAVICVLGHKDPKAYGEKMTNIRKSLREEGYSPVGAVAFINEADFNDKGKRESAMIKMSASMGAPRDRTYAFVNHIAAKTTITQESTINVLEILDTALISAEMYIKVQQQREAAAKARAKPTTDATSLSVRDFMAQIGQKHGWEEAKVDSAVQKLEDEDVYNVAGLKEFWGEVKSKLSLGMRSAIQNALFPK